MAVQINHLVILSRACPCMRLRHGEQSTVHTRRPNWKRRSAPLTQESKRLQTLGLVELHQVTTGTRKKERKSEINKAFSDCNDHLKKGIVCETTNKHDLFVLRFSIRPAGQPHAGADGRRPRTRYTASPDLFNLDPLSPAVQPPRQQINPFS